MATSRQHLPTTDELAKALEALEEARDAFEAACYTVRDSIDLTPLTIALAAWRAAAETVNEEALNARNDIEAYQEERSDRWHDSARGHAVEQWRQDLDDLPLDMDPVTTLMIDIGLTGATPSVDLVTEPYNVLPETPDIPVLDDAE